MPTRRNLLALVAALFVFASCDGGTATPETPQPATPGFSGFSPSETRLQAAFLTNGPANDFGYNSAHDAGRQAAEKALGGTVKTGILENIPETEDAERTMERLVESGVKVVVATSFGYQDSTVTVAARHPDVKFLQAWGFKQGPNIATYSAKMYESWYLMGIVAGRMTKSNKLGVVAAHPIPPMKWQIDAYTLGARSVNPEATVTVTFINHWFDPVLASQASEALVNQGSDVLAGVLDNSVGVAQAAEKRGVWLIAHNTDLSKFAPTMQLTGTEWLWAPLYEKELRDAQAGTWTGGTDRAGGLEAGYVGILPFSSSVPESVRAEVEAARAKIISGKLQVYAGPIKDNAGVEKVPAGKAMTHDEVMGIDWMVDGVTQ